MRCLTVNEARNILSVRSLLGENNLPRLGEPEMNCGLFYFGDECLTNTFWVALRMIESVGPFEAAWLWVHEPDTWKRNGLHLYDRLRLSYGDHRLIGEAPVHQFSGYEQADLCSFLSVAIINEWSFYIVTSHDYGRLFVSQSSGAEVWVRKPETLDSLVNDLKSHDIAITVQPFGLGAE